MDTNNSALILTQDLIKKYSQYVHIKGIEHPDIGKGYISGVKDVLFSENGVRIGKLFLESDGVWNFWPEETNGYIPDYIMIAIGSIMLELNSELSANYDIDYSKNHWKRCEDE